MAVTHLEIHTRQPYEDGMQFGAVGAYERLDGRIHFAVDPAHAANAAIVDLDRAARDAEGLVHFAADFCLLQPVEAARGNGRIIFDVVNRGRKRVPQTFNHVVGTTAITPRIEPGDGFIFREGWSVVWCGWQWDVIRSDALMGLDAPVALEPVPGKPGEMREIQGPVLVWWQPSLRTNALLLADRVHHPYAAADIHEREATLSVRDSINGAATILPRDQWRFARDENGTPVPDDRSIWLDGGFEPGKVYEAVYRTRRCPVVGSGLLAVRDTVAYLRYSEDDANPAAGRIERAYAYGVSQSGRFLRHFLHLGLNLDEGGRQVYDGLFIHVAGARRGEFNHRYAQPSQQHTQSFGHLPPFAYDAQTDPDTGASIPGLLDRQRQIGGVPKVLATNSSAEYWRGDTSLMHTDLSGNDVALPDECRIYHFASTQHGPGTLPLTNSDANDGVRGAHAFSVVDYIPLMRAALVNFDRWVSDGTEPPPNTIPRVSDGTAVTMAAALDAYRAIPGMTVPDVDLVPNICRVDLGDEVADGIGHYPARIGARYPIFVAAPDADGNEVQGVRLPFVSVPVATVTGWNPRHLTTGGQGQIIPMQGSTVPFAATAEDRERSGDPRPAIAERYPSREAYLDRVRSAAASLAAERYVLAEDIPLIVDLAAERYDAFTRVMATRS